MGLMLSWLVAGADGGLSRWGHAHEVRPSYEKCLAARAEGMALAGRIPDPREILKQDNGLATLMSQ